MIQKCRLCAAPLSESFCDLGMSPPSNSFVRPEDLGKAEAFYPLHAFVCAGCFLVQIPEHKRAIEIFSHDYAYFSSFSESWLAHCRDYAAAACARFSLGPKSQVIEIASNDGYLLQYFRDLGVPVLGIEPSANVAAAAEAKGIPTQVAFFSTENARSAVAGGMQADLLVGNNVLAHVPDLNDFVEGMRIALKATGVLTMEFPHLLSLMAESQFDTIYHEHYSYFSFLTVQRVFAEHGLTLFDVEELPTHGGSLRIYGRHAGNDALAVGPKVNELASRERRAGLDGLRAYRQFAESVRESKRAILDFLIGAKRAGKRIAGYGAAAKGNTLLNYCGVRGDFIDFVVDRSPHKQGLFMPGTRIPIFGPERVRAERPDYLLILPWNLKDEIVAQMAHIRDWGGKFVVPIPQVRVLP